MPNFPGFDSDQYPGDENMGILKLRTNLAWCAFYLAPAPAHRDDGWMAKRSLLASQGWGFAPVFVGRQLNEALAGGGQIIPEGQEARAGAADGLLCADLMARAGFEPKRWVYLDIENGPPMEKGQVMYVRSWALSVRARGFQPGIYCSHLLADGMVSLAPGARVWTVKVPDTAEHDASHYGKSFPIPDPHAGGFQYAFMWQFEQNAVINVDGLILTVDLDVAVLRDPSR